jgi:hypothetical protein
MSMKFEKDLLGHVLGQGRVAQHGPRRGKNGPMMKRKSFIKAHGSRVAGELIWRGVNQGSCSFAHLSPQVEHRPGLICGKFFSVYVGR